MLDLDRFEMAAQGEQFSKAYTNEIGCSIPAASEYEVAHGKNLQPFFDSSIPHIHHPEVREWAASLTDERKARLHEHVANIEWTSGISS